MDLGWLFERHLSSPRTARVFPRKGPLLVHPLRMLFILRRNVLPSGVLTPSHNPHTPPTVSPVQSRSDSLLCTFVTEETVIADDKPCILITHVYTCEIRRPSSVKHHFIPTLLTSLHWKYELWTLQRNGYLLIAGNSAFN